MASNGSTVNDVCIIYDTNKDQFLVDTNKYFYDAANFHNKNYAVSQFTPTVFYDEYGADDNGS